MFPCSRDRLEIRPRQQFRLVTVEFGNFVNRRNIHFSRRKFLQDLERLSLFLKTGRKRDGREESVEFRNR